MTDKDPIAQIKKIKRKYLFVRGSEVMLWSLAAALLAFFIMTTLSDFLLPGLVAAGLGLIVAYSASRRMRLFGLDEKRIALYLNRRYPRLQESADLLLKREEDLSLLQMLQRNQALQTMEEIYPTIKVPHHVGRASIALVISIAAGMLLTSFLKPLDGPKSMGEFKQIKPVAKQFLPPTIKTSTITVSPPAYTQVKKFTSPDFDLQLPEGSTVKWSITFDRPVSKPAIIFSAQDTVLLTSRDLENTIERTITKSGFYQLTWKNQDGIPQYSDYYKLEIITDNPPGINIQQPDQHLELDLRAEKTIHLAANITDDYGLTTSSIIATVSKGTGESVKFREEKFRFDNPGKITGKQVLATKTLDLTKIGMEPGDELYFYIEATDNRVPRANRTRTETYFITLQDTASIENSVEASLGVDLMPEYFRSQRQIIIDSEKLLREKSKISKPNFNERSNELAHDQKVLRLRYGEFLGEEFESSIGPQNANDHAGTDEDIEKKFGHDHDTENEHNLVEEPKPPSSHKHGNETSLANKSNALEGFVHAHDNEEEATFFVQSIKAKLKAAVTIMWDAELYLRLYQPEKSLPYQYRALKLLKEISQDSRIYVHRTGFDPPPLKEDKRLTGDLSDVKSSISKVQSPERENKYHAISQAISTIEHLIDDDSIAISATTKEILSNAGREVATLELKQPGRYLKTLSWLNELLQDKVNGRERKDLLIKIRSTLWNALPRETPTPSQEAGAMHALDREFLKNLDVRQ